MKEETKTGIDVEHWKKKESKINKEERKMKQEEKAAKMEQKQGRGRKRLEKEMQGCRQTENDED